MCLCVLKVLALLVIALSVHKLAYGRRSECFEVQGQSNPSAGEYTSAGKAGGRWIQERSDSYESFGDGQHEAPVYWEASMQAHAENEVKPPAKEQMKNPLEKIEEGMAMGLRY